MALVESVEKHYFYQDKATKKCTLVKDCKSKPSNSHMIFIREFDKYVNVAGENVQHGITDGASH